MTDDQGWGDLSLHGNPVLQTPNLDRMAAESVRLQQFYVHPVCTPTRAALMTGRHPQRTGAIDTYRGRAMMRAEEVTLAEVMASAGWRTGLFGKWHLGDEPPMRPMDQGFQRTLVHRGGGIGQPSDPLGAEGKYTDPTLSDDGELVEHEGYCTDVFFAEAERWMAACAEADEPFLCVITPNAPHTPLHDVPEDLLRKYRSLDLGPEAFAGEVGRQATFQDEDRLARLYAMVENIDGNMGGLCRFLDSRGLSESTLVLFLCDNGPQGRRFNAGLRGAKGSVYEGGVRSPLLARWPGTLAPSVQGAGYGAHLDLFPTVLDATGLEALAPEALDGSSLLPLLSGAPGAAASAEERPLVIQWHRGDAPVRGHHALVRLGDLKLVQPTRPWDELDAPPAWAPELYELSGDPFEERDLAGERPAELARLASVYDAWFEDAVGPPMDHAERARAYQPDPIQLGAEPVTLTIQDWRPVEGEGWGRNGTWRVEATSSRPLDLVLVAPAGRRITAATARFRSEAGVLFEERRVAPSDAGRRLTLRAEGLPVRTPMEALFTLEFEGAAARGPHQVLVLPSSGG